jgi:hypothetical protein
MRWLVSREGRSELPSCHGGSPTSCGLRVNGRPPSISVVAISVTWHRGALPSWSISARGRRPGAAIETRLLHIGLGLVETGPLRFSVGVVHAFDYSSANSQVECGLACRIVRRGLVCAWEVGNGGRGVLRKCSSMALGKMLKRFCQCSPLPN